MAETIRGTNHDERFEPAYRICSTNDFFHSALHQLEGQPIATRRQCIATLTILLGRFWTPVTRADALDQSRRDSISFDRQRVICIALIDLIDGMEIGLPIRRKARCFGEDPQHGAAHGIPRRTNAAGNGGDRRGNLAERVTGAERVGFAYVVAGADLFGYVGAVDASRTIGRVRVLPHGQPLTHATDALSLSTLLATSGSREHVLRYLKAGIADGVSGVMPKTLKARATAVLGEYIVKTGPASYPGLAVNEYLCLEVARRAGLRVPTAELSRDGQVLVVRRFDRPVSGEWLAVEDFCALKGLDPVSKYSGSLEDLAKILLTYVGERQGENALELYTLLLLNCAVRNADAHLKNFALTYTSIFDVALSPVYDVVTVTVYPQHADDIPGLTIAGKKVWRAGKLLCQLGHGRRCSHQRAALDRRRAMGGDS